MMGLGKLEGSAWVSMMRKDSCVSTGSSPGKARSRVVTEPMTQVSGARSS